METISREEEELKLIYYEVGWDLCGLFFYQPQKYHHHLPLHYDDYFCFEVREIHDSLCAASLG